MKRKLWSVLALLFCASLGTGCYSTGPTEIGVLTVKLGVFSKRGVQKETYAPGATYFFIPWLNDWHTFDTRLQNLEMVSDTRRGDRPYQDDLEFKTRDGNDVRVNVTVAWRINPKQAPHLLRFVGTTLRQIKDKLVRPACRTFVRDVLNELTSEDYYVAGKRTAKGDKARDILQQRLGPEGIIVEQVILGEHGFSKKYEEIIRAKKLAEQKAEALKSGAHAAYQQALRKLEQAKGLVRQRAAHANGVFAQMRYQSDAAFIRMEREAQAILVEAQAQAQAITARNKALAGSGGRTLVKLRIAEALKDKKIILIPTGSKSAVGVQTMDINTLLKAVLGKSSRR